jgi:hypothetical protein
MHMHPSLACVNLSHLRHKGRISNIQRFSEDGNLFMKDVYQYNRAENIVTVTSYSYDQKYVVGSLAPVPEGYIEWCKKAGVKFIW